MFPEALLIEVNVTAPLTVKASLIVIKVESVDLIVLPLISIVPKVCVVPDAVILFVTVKSLLTVASLLTVKSLVTVALLFTVKFVPTVKVPLIVCVVPEAVKLFVTVKLFPMVISFAKENVTVSGDDTTALIEDELANFSISPAPTICCVDESSSI